MPIARGGRRATIKCLLGANQGQMGEPGRAVRPYTVFTPILASLTSKPRLPFLFSLGSGEGQGLRTCTSPDFTQPLASVGPESVGAAV